MEFVLIPQRDGTAKRLPIPVDVLHASDDRSAVLAYVKNPPAQALADAETVPHAVPASAEPDTSAASTAKKER